MKLYQRIATYALIGTASIGLFGCGKKDKPRQPVQQPSPRELKTTEKSPYTFEKSIIQDKFNVKYSGVGAAPIAVTCGDLDGDGDLEVIVATRDGITIYENKTEQKK